MSSCAELADYDWLTGSAAAALLRDLANGSEPLHAAATRLRRDLSAERVHLLLEQVELRARAAAKFARADVMFFTRLGLEQATDAWVAAHKARRFAGHGPAADLCCGIGGDLLALAQVVETVGVDRDPIAVCLAAANARVLGIAATVRTCEIEGFNACGLASWHIDPDRRPGGKRTTSLDFSSPASDAIDHLLRAAPHAAVKLAPAAEVPAAWDECCELEWISRDRECRQLVAWHGDLAERPGERRATVLSNDGTAARTVVGQPNLPTAFARQLDRFVFEPDPAALAAKLTGALAAEHGLSSFSAGIAYLTGAAAIDDPALACFEVNDILPLKPRLLAEHFRERRIGRLEIKKRGVDHNPETLRKQLHLAGDEAATLFLTKLNGKHVAIVARRVKSGVAHASQTPDSRPPTPSHATCL